MDRHIEQNFFSHVRERGDCWEWTGYRLRDGYGMFGVYRERTYLAHRWAYEFLIGAIPDGLTLDHLCRNRACVNPYHLDPVPHAVNVRRALPRKPSPPRTECPHGHPYTEENTHRRSDGTRECRACGAERARARRSRARES